MEGLADSLARDIISQLDRIPQHKRFLIAIAGIPGSGKSVLAASVLKRTNRLLKGKEEQAILVGLDGWHLSRKELNRFEDVKEAYDKRGAHWTFDAKGYVDFISSLRAPIPSPSSSTSPPILAPTFDHALKDPTPDSISIHPHHRIIIIEGLYALLSIPPWNQPAQEMDERWFVSVEREIAKERLIRRHVETGVTKDLEEGEWRAENNDLPNGDLVLQNMIQPTRRFQTIQDPTFVSRLGEEEAAEAAIISDEKKAGG